MATDVPGEYYLDPVAQLLYLYPPTPLSADTAITLTAQAGAVVNVTSDVADVSLARLDIRDGRHAGVSAVGARGARFEQLSVHGHGTHGIVLEDAFNSTVRDSEVFDVGCSGVRATGGRADALEEGRLLVEVARE